MTTLSRIPYRWVVLLASIQLCLLLIVSYRPTDSDDYNTSTPDLPSFSTASPNSSSTFNASLQSGAIGRSAAIGPPFNLNPPTMENTLIASINMKRFNNMAQRLICSLRAKGDWHGEVMLLTDTQEIVDEYTTVFQRFCGPVTVVKGREEDLLPLNASGLPIRYRGPQKMPVKRFKTLLWDYVERNPRLKEKTEYILYLDVDIVVGAPLAHFLKQSYDRTRQATGLLDSTGFTAPTPTSTTGTKNPRIDMGVTESFVGVFPEWKEREGQFHTGIMFLHKHYSRFCLKAWQEQIDEKGAYDTSDQVLMKDLPEQTNKTCMFQHIDVKCMLLPDRSRLRRRDTRTFVHFTSFRSQNRVNPLELQQAYLLDLLELNASSPALLSIFGEGNLSLVG